MKRIMLGLGFAMLLFAPAAAPASPTTEYHGGLLDDGFYDDDWYVDYYDEDFGMDRSASLDGEGQEYEASQFYDDAGNSGLFDV